MGIWLAIALGLGIVATVIALARRRDASGVYVGIVQRCLGMGVDNDCLEVRAYVDEPLARALPPPSKVAGWMFIRETNRSVPLTVVRVPPYVPSKLSRGDGRGERKDVSVLPVIFRFDPVPDVVVHAGQLVDVCVEARQNTRG